MALTFGEENMVFVVCFIFEMVFPLSRPGWLQIQNPPALTSQTLELQACTAALDKEEQAC